MSDNRIWFPRALSVEPPIHTAHRSLWIRLLAVVTPVIVAGSGLLNLSALIGGPPPSAYSTWLRDLFPLDFGRLNHSATLLLGFALILTALHLTAMKRRAVHLAIALSLASALFHFTRAWDAPEAVCSVLAAAMLFAVRRAFPIGSAQPDLPLALRRAASALAVAAVYGAAGFWLLEPHEFGRNFNWWEAGAHTIRVMFLLDGSGLSPRTPYAAWFIESLYIMSASTFLYCGVTLFRPVAYRFHQSHSGRDLAARIAASHGRSGLDFFKQASDKSLFFSASGDCFIAYRVANHYALVLGDPVGPSSEIPTAVREFVGFCQRRGWRVGFHQTGGAWLGLYRNLGFRHLKIGEDAVVHLDSFTLEGSANKEFRNTINRLDRLGYRIERFEPALDAGLVERLKSVSDDWLTIPGHRERKFTLGRFDAAYVASTQVYAVFDPTGQIAAFLNLIPSYLPGLATVDLMRRRAGSLNGIMDYLFAKTFLDLRARGFRRISLGMAPGGVSTSGHPATAEERALGWAMRQFPSRFRVESLRRFKAKFAHDWEPRYAVYNGPFDLARLALALRTVSEDGKEIRSAA
ncbi:MAG: phosphatidylglycerol lysyltransferase domain-containing protein [Acidobacteriota bacterium]